jgi:hypothetical protein
MRSDLVFDAAAHVPSRYVLTMLAAKATRKLHRPNTRIQDTANDAFARICHTTRSALAAASGNYRPSRSRLTGSPQKTPLSEHGSLLSQRPALEDMNLSEAVY